MNVAIKFWIIFFVLNSFYFWPRYILNFSTTNFFPLKGFFRHDAHRRWRQFLIRLNYDIFRLSTDFFVLTLIYPLFLTNIIDPILYTVVLCVYFSLSLVYQVYYTAFDRIYHVDPVMYNDWFMLKVAFRIFIYEYGWKNFFISLVALVLAVGSFLLVYEMVNTALQLSFGLVSYVFMAVFVIAGTFSITQYDAIQFPQLVFQSQLSSIVHNISASLSARRQVRQLTLDRMKEYNVDPSVKLLTKPNIYFIVVESYGRVIMDEQRFKDHYLGYLKELQSSLNGAGWHSTSNLTRSPITGGASWISYTSMLYGLNVKGQGLYLTLFKNKFISEYDSLFHWLKRQGYTTSRLSNLGGYEKMEIPYDQYSTLYGIDKWIKYKDLNYQGREYGFGPSPPDQYAIHFAEEELRTSTHINVVQQQPSKHSELSTHDKDLKQEQISKHVEGSALKGLSINESPPRAMFFITQNSHTPFETPTQVVDDWRELSDEKDRTSTKSKIWSKPDFARYGDAIEYQIRFLTDFILKKGRKDDIFILIGDHQPASLSIPISKFETPIHVISKDQEFVRLFNEYGFLEGMHPGGSKTPIAQEAIHWALLRSLIRRYGEEGAKLPDYLPNGIPF